MTENMIRLRLRSFRDSTFSTRYGVGREPSKVWWVWYERTQEAIRRGVSDADLPKEPSSQG